MTDAFIETCIGCPKWLIQANSHLSKIFTIFIDFHGMLSFQTSHCVIFLPLFSSKFSSFVVRTNQTGMKRNLLIGGQSTRNHQVLLELQSKVRAMHAMMQCHVT